MARVRPRLMATIATPAAPIFWRAGFNFRARNRVVLMSPAQILTASERGLLTSFLGPTLIFSEALTPAQLPTQSRTHSSLPGRVAVRRLWGPFVFRPIVLI